MTTHDKTFQANFDGNAIAWASPWEAVLQWERAGLREEGQFLPQHPVQ